MTSKFDALAYTKRLEDAGVPRDQAEVHATALTEVVGEFACRQDLLRLESSLRHEIEESEKRLVLQLNLFKTELIAKIDHLGAKIDRVDAKVDRVDAKVDRVDAKVDRMDAKVDHVDAKVDRLDAKVDHVDAKVDHVDAKVDRVDAKIDNVDAKVDSLRREFEARFKAIEHDLTVNRWLSGLIISLNIAMAIKIFFP
ncbi:hypothetical protein [Massilia rubra]|uniref:t-SNARE coiled-coil homology domain-containing protein n=1 Tax=Massilia rubra TaxID=2607910 RepID=A0ABX0LIN6_9BURK|nr:hypothetical protein [Massilia rubra]NHZ34448.1 hypothetical protein [Massilia rubra]